MNNYSLGNKTDVLHVNQNKREVPKDVAEKFARDNNLIFIGESSALSNQNIKEVMDALFESNLYFTLQNNRNFLSIKWIDN